MSHTILDDIKGSKLIKVPYSQHITADSIVSDSIRLMNKIDSSATNVIFHDTSPNGTMMIEDSLTINGIKVNKENVIQNIDIGALGEEDGLVINYNLQAKTGKEITDLETKDSNYLAKAYTTQKETNSIPKVPNIGGSIKYGMNRITGAYICDLNMYGSPTSNFRIMLNSIPNKNSIEDTITPEPTIIEKPILNQQLPNLILDKQVDKKYVTKDDILTYTITATNGGNLDLYDISVVDILAQQFEFITESVQINGTKKPEQSPLLGINIGTLPIGKNQTIQFKAKVVSTSNKPVANIAQASYYYDSEEVSSVGGNVESNEIFINISDVNITIEKSASENVVSVGDMLTYYVQINNIGDTEVLSIIFSDESSELATLIDGSFTINGLVVNNVNLKSGINIGNINVKGSINLSYTVEVLGSDCEDNLVNTAKIKYKYTLPDGTSGSKENDLLSSTYIVRVNNPAFKQLNIERSYELPNNKLDIHYINDIKSEVSIINSTVIENVKGESIEGQKITGYKLRISGIIRYTLEYTSIQNDDMIRAACFNTKFTESVILPVTYIDEDNLKIKAKIEHCTYSLVDLRRIYISSDIFLSAK